MPLELTDEETTALTALLRRTIADDRFPLSPRIRILQVVLDKLSPPSPATTAAPLRQARPADRPTHAVAARKRSRRG